MAIIFSIKTLLLSTAALSAALLFSLSLPLLRHFLTSVVPQIWSSLLSWLTPPYLYFVINGIIISIVASSKFQQLQQQASVEELPEKGSVEVQHHFEIPAVVLKSPAEIRPDFEVNREVVYGEMEKVKGKEEEEDFVISRSDWKPRRRDSMVSEEKPLVSVRIGHRKSVKASPEGNRPLGVAKPKRHETLESTWKTITDGRAIPLTRHLKKSDTWETHGRVRSDGQDHPKPVMKKSETTKEHSPVLSPSPGSGKLLRKESSLGQDELNRRVEAFIKKFNEEMRMQRQESINQYMEMVNRGSH
ncbi:hypothetical protein AAC387_Pa04g1731 [Persea americana]